MLKRTKRQLAAARYGWRFCELSQTYGPAAATTSTASTYSYHKHILALKMPVVIEKVIIDLKDAGTYTLSGLGADIVVTVGEATAGAEFVPTAPLTYLGGILSLTCTAGSAVHWANVAAETLATWEPFERISSTYAVATDGGGFDWRIVLRRGYQGVSLAGPRPRGFADYGPSVNGHEFTVAVWPDAQSESAANRLAQLQWIADNVAAWDIGLMVSVGDLTAGATTAEWEASDAAVDILDAAETPYLLVMGNHDFDSGAADDTRAATEWNTYFPQSRYTSHAWWSGGFYEASHSENLYLLRTMGGVDYLIIGLEFGPRQAVLNWALGLMDTYSARSVIVVTHGYLDGDGTWTVTTDAHEASSYFTTDTHNGDELWAELSVKANLLMVISGHQISTGYGAWRMDLSNHADEQVVHQIFANYQDWADCGYLRLLRFKPVLNEIEAFSYSPVADAWRWQANESGRYPLAMTRS